MDLAPSPFAPDSFPGLGPIAGIRMATAEAGIKYAGRTDVLLVAFDHDVDAAGVFTQSRCPSAPVDWCRSNIIHGQARALLVNSGNANAFTGMKGMAAASRSAEITAKLIGCAPEQVLLASTGVIGEPLDASKFESVLDRMAAEFSTADEAGSLVWLDAARAIMTTDTYPKITGRTVDFGGVSVTINGIAKGSGMIAPDMATMLSFIFTDAPIAAPVLQSLLSAAVVDSFNAITVDSDTSTSDTVLLFATGGAGGRGAARIDDLADGRTALFRDALQEVCVDLAQQIVKDGEGARKFIEVHVTGADDKESARAIALAIANSPLVKTAVAGEDANWGRIVMAVGKAGEPADRDKLAVWFGDVRVAVEGERDPDYSEDAASDVMKQSEITIRVDVGIGHGEDRVWTCDLTKTYVAINGDYRS